MKEKNNYGFLTLPDCKSYYYITIIKTMWNWGVKTDQQNMTENPKTDLHI